MVDTSHDLAKRLGRQAEAVCRHYLSAGRREGGYWLVGDVRNAPGRSMFVRLKASAKGPAGKWTDAATGEHGDLLVSSGKAAVWSTSRTSPMRRAHFSAYRVPSQNRIAPNHANLAHLLDRLRRRGACSRLRIRCHVLS